MLETIQKLKSHTYLDKKGNPIKKPRINYEQVLDAYTYIIQNGEGRVSKRLLRLAFTDKEKDFTEVLKETGYIKELKQSRKVKIELEGGRVEFISSPTVFSCDKREVSKEDNRYIQSLLKKLDKRKGEFGWFLENIKDTLSRTTYEGKEVSTDVKYTKGRYYTDYTSLPKEQRMKLKIDGKKTTSLDIKSAVIQILSKNYVEGITPMVMTDTLYKDIEKETGLDKEGILKSIFCHPKQQPKELDIYPFFSSVKNFKYNNGYKFIHYVYQWLETRTMNSIYELLCMNGIDVLPMHDSIIIKEEDTERVMEFIKMVTSLTFKKEY